MSITLPDSANLEPGEVPVCSLNPGAVFTMGSVRGVVMHQGRASTMVSLRQEKFRVITAADGTRSKPIRLPDRHEHWFTGAGVVPTGEMVDPKVFEEEKAPTPANEAAGERPVEEEAMATKTKKARAKKAPKEKKAKTYLVTSYGLTAKIEQEKNAKYLDPDNNGYAAVVVQTLRKAGDAVGFEGILAAVKEKVKTKANIEANLRWYVSDLLKKGLIKSVDDKVEAASAEEARAEA